jgi:hypothetical protein
LLLLLLLIYLFRSQVVVEGDLMMTGQNQNLAVVVVGSLR